MKIKQVKIKGFKSFPDSTVIELRPGVTAIVGPNGCGKSNILEAIRWVMGEQRVKSFRSKKMEDVIFNGSENRKPVGMAEVRLILSNNEGRGPASMADYNEIMVTRRLFRDGESNYELNNVSCRLSDIIDFFLDTGVGKNSYSIIEQGRVDMIVASKPEDRRVLIEEAAGISRYKVRRESTLKKLEQTEHNLTRINDIILEVKSQSISIKRQAGKAEKYMKLRESLRDLELGLHAYKCKQIGNQLTGAESVFHRQSELLRDNEVKAAGLSAEVEKNRLLHLKKEAAVKNLLEKRRQSDIDLSKIRANIDRIETKLLDLREKYNHNELERQRALDQQKELSKHLNNLNDSRSALDNDLRNTSTALANLTSNSESADANLRKDRESVDACREEVFELLGQISELKNAGETFHRDLLQITASIARIDAEWGSTNALLEDSDRNRELLIASIEQVSKALSDLDDGKIEGVERIRKLKSTISGHRNKLAEFEKKIAAKNARLESLKEIKSDYRQYENSVRRIMGHRHDIGPGFIIEPLAEIFDTAPERQRALAGVLRNRMQTLVCSSTADLLESPLHSDSFDGGLFLPMTPRRTETQSLSSIPGTVSMLDVVTYKPEFKDLAQHLFSNMYLVENIDLAFQFWNSFLHADFVTHDGSLLLSSGEVVLSGKGAGGSLIFEHRNEIATLSHEISLAERGADDLRISLKTLNEDLIEAETAFDDLQAILNEAHLNKAKLTQERERLAASALDAERKLDVLEKEREGAFREKVKVEAKIKFTADRIPKVEQIHKRKSETLQELISAGRRIDEEQKQRAKQIEEARVSHVKLVERNRFMSKESEAIRKNLENSRTQLKRLAAESADAEALSITLTAEKETCVHQEGEILRILAGWENSIETITTESQDLVRITEGYEKQLEKLNTSIRSDREFLHQSELKRFELRQQINSSVETMMERYHIDPSRVTAPDTVPSSEEIIETRAKIDILGEVNPAAINESRQIEERLTFLKEQESDLKNAVESLYSTINAINKTTRERFKAAFDSINEKFQEIFPYLFRGGEAKLELTDENNILETGIEILVRPPGKRVRNMDLLSGGEKALTAVALIFSIFLIKPAPFCLLDEVDAPLDDANIDRFNSMLRDLSPQTQFLVVTHNKRSMEEADCLYGVTMEEPGVSRTVSVEFSSA